LGGRTVMSSSFVELLKISIYKYRDMSKYMINGRESRLRVRFGNDLTA
jgi:hypothetical protein